MSLLREVPAESTQLREHAAAVSSVDIGGRRGRVVLLKMRHLVAHTEEDCYASSGIGIHNTLVEFTNSNNVTC